MLRPDGMLWRSMMPTMLWGGRFHCRVAWHVSAGLYTDVVVSNSSNLSCFAFCWWRRWAGKGEWGRRQKKRLIEVYRKQQANIAKMHLPQSSKQRCVGWGAFANVDVVDEIDSCPYSFLVCGVRKCNGIGVRVLVQARRLRFTLTY